MTREQIYKAALEEIAKPKVGYDQHLYCDTCLRWTELCCNPCPGYKARAALEVAAKVGGLDSDEDLYGIVLKVVEDARNSPVRGGNVHIATDVLRAVDAYLRGAR